MNFIHMILLNKTIIVPALAWFMAQVIKTAVGAIKGKRPDYTWFISSGGMPSSHTSFIVSLATVIGKNYGWNSGIFGISVAVALIVMYDAAGVRRAAGKQAEVLNKLVFSSNNKAQHDVKLKELLGHSPIEVVVGAVLGILLGMLLG